MSTTSTSVLSPEIVAAKRQFDEEGYTVVRGVLTSAEVEEIRTTFAEIHRDGVPNHYEPKKIVAAAGNPNDPLIRFPRVLHPHRFNARARHYLLHPKVAAILTALLEGEPLAAYSMFYFKPPGARGQALHQDQFYLLVEPGTCCAAWTAIDECDAENGGLCVVPKTGNAEIQCPQSVVNPESFSTHSVPVPAGHKAVLPKLSAGDTLFFNGSVIHGSGPNRSRDRFRRSFIGHYARGNLDRISKTYLPMVRMDGSDHMVEENFDRGPCGDGYGWKGAAP